MYCTDCIQNACIHTYIQCDIPKQIGIRSFADHRIIRGFGAWHCVFATQGFEPELCELLSSVRIADTLYLKTCHFSVLPPASRLNNNYALHQSLIVLFKCLVSY